MIFIFSIIIYFTNTFANAIQKEKNKGLLYDQKFLVLDVHTVSELPKNFRLIPNLNISGSAQFLPFQIKELNNKIKDKNINIVDLREESHGFINDIAVSFYNPEKALNNGLSSKEVIKKEELDLKEIKLNSKVNIFNKYGKIIKTLTSENVFNEYDFVKITNLYYVRLAVKDGHIPSPKVVDEFIELIKNKSIKDHFHFHCKHGDGRTTTFMAIYEMMMNTEGKSLETILDNQIKAGGIILTNEHERKEFLINFYNYTKSNINSNFKILYSDWVKENSI